MIKDMHIAFRELAQRAGMQQVYDIRPEQIDIFLNMAILNVVSTRISSSVQDTDNTAGAALIKTGQNNDFRTLFKVKDISFLSGNVFSLDDDGYTNGKFVSNDTAWPIEDAHIYYDYHVNYCISLTGWTVGGNKPVKNGDWVSAPRRVRLVEHNYLGTTLADNILTPTFKNPILTTHAASDGDINKLGLDIYFGGFDSRGQFGKGLVPYKFYIGYYRKPAVVSCKDEVDCDLPDHLHLEVIQKAVASYQISKNGGVSPGK